MQINQRHQLIYGTLTVFLSLQGTEAPKEHVATGDQTLPWRRCRRPTALRMQIRRSGTQHYIQKAKTRT